MMSAKCTASVSLSPPGVVRADGVLAGTCRHRYITVECSDVPLSTGRGAVAHAGLSVMARGLPDLGSESKDVCHRRAVCSLKVKLYQRDFLLVTWLHLPVIATKTFVSPSNPPCAALGTASDPSQSLAKGGEVCWHRKQSIHRQVSLGGTLGYHSWYSDD